MELDEASIERLALGFEATTLTDAEWTHAAHIVVALRYVRRHGAREALPRMREALLRWAASRGRIEAYHETITRAWIAIVGAFVAREDRGQPMGELARALLDATGGKEHLRRFYSPERILSAEARARFVEPDLAPLPLDLDAASDRPGGAVMDTRAAAAPLKTRPPFL
jgi:hypothetical protein